MTNHTTWLESHVRLLLQDIWEQCRVTVDDDGDVPFREGSAMGFVSVVMLDDQLWVRVWAYASCSVRRTLRLAGELDEINRRSGPTKVGWHHGCVIVEHGIHSDGVTTESLRHAVKQVGSLANEIGPLIAAMYNGATPFPPEAEAHESDDDAHHDEAA